MKETLFENELIAVNYFSDFNLVKVSIKKSIIFFGEHDRSTACEVITAMNNGMRKVTDRAANLLYCEHCKRETYHLKRNNELKCNICGLQLIANSGKPCKMS